MVTSSAASGDQLRDAVQNDLRKGGGANTLGSQRGEKTSLHKIIPPSDIHLAVCAALEQSGVGCPLPHWYGHTDDGKDGWTCTEHCMVRGCAHQRPEVGPLESIQILRGAHICADHVERRILKYRRLQDQANDADPAGSAGVWCGRIEDCVGVSKC